MNIPILAYLSGTRTILGTRYKVAWDCEKNLAVILQKDGKEWVQTGQEFTSELAAHGYLNLLNALNAYRDKDDWKTLCSDNE